MTAADLPVADGLHSPEGPAPAHAEPTVSAPTGRVGRENYPVQKKFLIDDQRHRWLVHAAHDSGPRVGYVRLLRHTIDLLRHTAPLLADLQNHITAHPPTATNNDKTITLNVTLAQDDWLRTTAHRTGELGISQQQLIHAIIDWLAEHPDVLAALRADLPAIQ
jgi:hypothetical protein